MDMKNKNHLSVNTLLCDRYVVGLALGSNKLGITYLGYDNVEKKKVAIKEYYPEDIASRNNNMVSGTDVFAAGLQQFVKEGNVLKEKKGLPSIVEVFDVIEENGTAYIIMEYIEGTSLEEIVKGNRLFPVKRMQDLLEPVLKSLQVLHEAGLIHQNISPDNLIFTNEGNLKLIGFGCLQGVVSEKSRGYAPIEQYRKQEERKPSIDIYAICATIYRCITGKIPVDATQRVGQGELQQPGSMGIEISEVQEAVIMMGLSVEAEKRLQRIQALYRALYGVALNDVPQPEIKPEPIAKSTEPEEKSEPIVKSAEPEEKSDSIAKSAEPEEKPEPIAKSAEPEEKSEPVAKPAEPEIKEAQPQPIPVQQSVQANVQNNATSKKEKGSNKGLIIGICVALVLVVLGGAGVFLATSLLSGMPSNEEVVTEVAEVGETIQAGEAQNAQAEVPETNKLQQIKDALTAQDYVTTIDMVLALSEEERAQFGETELAAILQEAVDGKKNAILAEVDGYVNSASYDDAFAAISDGMAYFTSIAENEAVTDLADTQFLDDKEEEIKQKHKDYLSATAESCANQADEPGMEEALTRLSSYISAEEVETKRIKCYGKLVVAVMTQMRNSGASTEEILAYINENLAKTDNNCWVLEFWDYYNTVYAMESGQGISMDTNIRNVSDSGYILENSNSMNLTIDDISHLSQYELYLALYEIYARHGRGFNDASVTSYFSQYSWYQETTRPEVFDESVLNEYERYNRDLIIEYQYTLGYR